ncbi:hypothetical protein Aph01nite_46040 [Acrocarpospora phusangensis]|uniref:Uncharacterized protein n=1 Tax=Acrocarpospora phusangensis TaxID=1070424 RepID=A0A919QBT1_9ACTN|nr:hypothetical protein Aph01nite_46040 [Acrocarpospora phusangensis]
MPWVQVTSAGLSPPVDSVVFLDGGDSPWGRIYPASDDVRDVAAAEWVATARAVAARVGVAALPHSLDEDATQLAEVEVEGSGLLAALIRDMCAATLRAGLEAGPRVGVTVPKPAAGERGPARGDPQEIGGHLPRSAEGGRAPGVIVETGGSAWALTKALGRVARLGTVVLAARPAMSGLMARTYGDVHRRGLTIAGVPWVSAAVDGDEEWVAWAGVRLCRWGER